MKSYANHAPTSCEMWALSDDLIWATRLRDTSVPPRRHLIPLTILLLLLQILKHSNRPMFLFIISQDAANHLVRRLRLSQHSICFSFYFIFLLHFYFFVALGYFLFSFNTAAAAAAINGAAERDLVASLFNDLVSSYSLTQQQTCRCNPFIPHCPPSSPPPAPAPAPALSHPTPGPYYYLPSDLLYCDIFMYAGGC